MFYIVFDVVQRGAKPGDLSFFVLLVNLAIFKITECLVSSVKRLDKSLSGDLVLFIKAVIG